MGHPSLADALLLFMNIKGRSGRRALVPRCRRPLLPARSITLGTQGFRMPMVRDNGRFPALGDEIGDLALGGAEHA